MTLPSFEEKHAQFSANGFAATNEEPFLQRELLKGMKFQRAASIASGGEIPLFVLLPRCEEVVAIDHSYRALTAFYIKILLLVELGPKGMKKLISNYDLENFKAQAAKVVDKLPEPLKGKYSGGTKYGDQGTFTHNDWSDTRREWHYVPDRLLSQTIKRLDRITLVHGDLMDLKDKGEFDCLYISNALEHRGRNGKCPQPDDFLPILKEGGLLLTATAGKTLHHNKGYQPIVESLKGFRSSWFYQVHKKATPPIAEANINAQV
jgi:hypothetical protein